MPYPRDIIHPKLMERLRPIVASTLPSRCTLRRPTDVDDGQGGTTTVWTETPNVPCRLESGIIGFSGEKQAGEQIQMMTPWRVTFEYGQDIEPEDQITIDGRTFEVNNNMEPQSYSAETTVLATEIL